MLARRGRSGSCGRPVRRRADDVDGEDRGRLPAVFQGASGNRVADLDGHELVDFCLGDTGAMAGHSPPATVAAVTARFAEAGGATTMMPTEDAAVVADELSRRFGPLQWSFSLTATDANRWAIRLSRAATGRPKILVNSWCYHGSIDETMIVTSDQGPAARPGNVGAPCDVTLTSRVAEYNDLDTLERELEHRDVAAVLMEPALTNVGIVLPEPGYLEGLRTLTRDAGHPADQRRDPHTLGRPGRLYESVVARTRHRHGGQGDRRRHPRGGVRAVR